MQGHVGERASVWRGILIISAIYFFILLFDFLRNTRRYASCSASAANMYDMRSGIFGHLQRLPMTYFDRNPVGDWYPRTTDVDALNDLFAAGVVP